MQSNQPTIGWGAYCLASDGVLEWFQAFVRSFRMHHPDLPLTVIPYNSSIQQLRLLQEQFHFTVMDEATASRFDKIAPRVAGMGIAGGTFRKLACFLGKYERFVFFDSDIVVTMRFDPLLSDFEASAYDFVFFDTDLQVFKPAFAREMMARHGQLSFNSGAFLARRNMLDADRILAAAEAGGKIRGEFAIWGEQPFLNYLFQVSGCRMTHVNRLAPELAFKPKAWSPFQYDIVRDCYLDPEDGILPFIHWAGQEHPYMIESEVFLKYRTLGMTSSERASYVRAFHYRRLRRRLKEQLIRLRVFNGWLARRDEYLRQSKLITD